MYELTQVTLIIVTFASTSSMLVLHRDEMNSQIAFLGLLASLNSVDCIFQILPGGVRQTQLLLQKEHL
jgi:hypothetical protein